MHVELSWRWSSFAELSNRQLYALLAARSAVFVVEQGCAYQDLDGYDVEASHLIAWHADEVVACLRVLLPGAKYAEPSIGRVLTARPFRGTGLGRELMRRGVQHVDESYPGRATRIGAQAHLEKFYAQFGFVKASDTYVEDGIPHIEMLRAESRTMA